MEGDSNDDDDYSYLYKAYLLYVRYWKKRITCFCAMGPCYRYFYNLYFTNEKTSDKCQILDSKIIFSGPRDFVFNQAAIEPICISKIK